MRFTAPVGLAKFFSNNGYIELEKLLSEEEVSLLSTSIDRSLASRLGMTIENMLQLSFSDLYQAGHDLTRIDPNIKKILWSKKLAEIVYEITNVRPIRFAYDQAFRVGNHLSDGKKFFNDKPSLSSLSLLQGKLFGLMLAIKPEKHETFLFSPTPGNGILFSSSLPLDLESFTKTVDQSYLLIVFTEATSIVLSKQENPHPFSFKQLGYSVGDHLKDDMHPLLFK